MAYDAARRLVVLFGGWDASNNVLDDTWTYDGATWAQLAPAAAPTARHSAAAAWRPAANELLLFGGAVPDAMGGDTLLGDLWAWNGTTWRAITTSGTSAPAARLGVGLIGDAGTDELVLFGGAQTWDLQNVMGDMWRHDATGWTKFTGATPPARGAPGFVYDGADAVGILFGGVGTGGASLVDTWSWSGATLQWTEQSPSASPPARGQAGMAFDSTRNVVVLFGGADGNNDYADTWEYTY
jgi:hypothetical protein